MSKRASPIEAAGTQPTRYALEISDADYARAALTLAASAVRRVAAPQELAEVLSMLGHPRFHIEAVEPPAKPSGGNGPRCRLGGHLMIGSNIGTAGGTNRRFCRACRNANLRKKRKGVPQKPREKRHVCKYNHPLSGTNLIIIANGDRRCRECITRPRAPRRSAA